MQYVERINYVLKRNTGGRWERDKCMKGAKKGRMRMRDNNMKEMSRISPGCFFPPEGGVGLVPKRGCLLTHITHSSDDMSLESDGGMILTGKNRKTRRKTCLSATLSTTNPTRIDPGGNPGLRGERPATNDLSHGTATGGVAPVYKLRITYI
jgi:hypothetical protein